MLKCPRCSKNQGRVELVDNRYKDFFCCRCKLQFPMKHYSTRIKEWEENNIEVEEVVFN